MKVIRIGGLYDKPMKKHQMGSIYDPEGLAPPLDTCGGGYREPIIVEYEHKSCRDAESSGKTRISV